MKRINALDWPWILTLISIAAAAAAFIVAGNAHAQTGTGPPTQHGPPPPAPLTVSYTAELPLDGNPTASFELPRFDPRLGTLRAASLTVTARHRQTFGVEQTAPGRALFYWGDGPLFDTDAPCWSYLQISAPSGQTACADLNFWPLVTQKLTGFDGAIDFAGPSGTTTNLIADHVLDPVALDLAGLTGTGEATFAVTREGFVFHSGTTANCAGLYQRRIGATATITYRFN